MKKQQLQIIGASFFLAIAIAFGIITLQSPGKTYSIKPVIANETKPDTLLSSEASNYSEITPTISKHDQDRLEINILNALNCVRLKNGLTPFTEFDEKLSEVARLIIRDEHIDNSNYPLIAIQALQFNNNKTEGCVVGGFNMNQLNILGQITEVGVALAPPDPFGGIGSVIVGR